jgi:hypothetical protein
MKRRLSCLWRCREGVAEKKGEQKKISAEFF